MSQKPLRVLAIANRSVLVTRGSARRVAAEVLRRLAGTERPGNGGLEVDFAGIDGVTPSFVDEFLAMILDSRVEWPGAASVTFVNAPTRLSSKFRAIGRGLGFSIEEPEPGTWLINRDRSA